MLYLDAMEAPNYFIPDRDPPRWYPSSFLRAPAISVAQKYIEALTAPNDLVLDPFGAMPNVAYAAHALGRRAIVIETHPLWAWLARTMLTLPGENEINAALTKLGDAKKDEAPLRAHLTQLYATTCTACGKLTPADYFVRARSGALLRRHYTCGHCGATRDDEATEDDAQRAQAFDARGLHYHIAFERVVPAEGRYADRIHKILDVYTPRNLYALVTLTQKIDLLFRQAREFNILLLLLLHLLDRGTAFYASPESGARLKTHPQFIEFNLWHEIEIAARALGTATPSLPLSESIADVVNADSPRVFVGRGNLAALAHEIPPQSVALVLSSQPTRRLGILALSYMWCAWTLGRPVAQPLVSLLDPQKDMLWELRHYAERLDESFKAMHPLMRSDARAVFAFNESHHLAIETLLLTSANARLDLESFLFQPSVGDAAHSEFGDLRGSYRIAFRKNGTLRSAPAESLESELPSDEARALWRPAPSVNIGQLEKNIRNAALDAGKEILARRGEALAYTWVHHAAYTRLARDGWLTQVWEAKLKTPPGRFIHQAVVTGLSAGYAEDFDHYETPTQFVWLRRTKLGAPLIERVDDAVRAILERGSISDEELQDAIYRQFPGDLTPEAGLIELCAAANERLDVNAKSRAIAALTTLGERLGFQANLNAQDSNSIRAFDLVWQAEGEIAHAFIWRERAHFTDLIEIQMAPAHGYIIVPENIVGLMQEKTRRLPHLADAFYEAGWNFVRRPFVERLLSQETIERHDLVFITGLEPPSLEQGTQLELL